MYITTENSEKYSAGETFRLNAVDLKEIRTEQPDVFGHTVLPVRRFETIEELRKEAQEISQLLEDPTDPVTDEQGKMYASIEKRITRLGLAMGIEAEHRAGFNKHVFIADIADSSNELSKALAHESRISQYLRDTERRLTKLQDRNDRSISGQKELALLEAEFNHLIAESSDAHSEVERLQSEEDLRVAELRQRAIERMSAGYASVIADIRPCGGIVANHELSDPQALDLLNATVGKHYPSDWLKSSVEYGEMAVAPSKEYRARYAAHQFYPSEEGEGSAVQESFAGLVLADKAVDFIKKITEEGIAIHGHGTSFDNGDGDYRVVEFAYRKEFDPAVDEMDAAGVPVGEGWKYGYVPRTVPGGLHMPEQMVWYREPVNYGRVVPTVYLAPDKAGKLKRKATAYHEFAHRVEDVVRNGIIEHLEEAFLVRRTTDANGNREELSMMHPGDGTFSGTELGRKGTFMMHYIGKEYLTHRSREVLAIGSETLFAGSYGSFMGLDGKHKPDLDHRGFTLGIFAVA